ncbi:hypothetical protein [Sphingomonas sp. STIS6.2]|uniref:hypothetical protein n=1 Tax=Sphingomonas sp. STIS6.2 TaxID=1379700 RepID=UPI000B0EE82B|nr:hypothetical protein [Sphingomonas sp. STIS6.2]
MNDLFHTARDRASCCTAAAMRLVPSFEGQDKITRALLNKAMTTAFGGSDADGRWTQRESFEVLELALALAMRSRSTDRLDVTHDDVLQAAVLLDRLPTQTVRSEEQIEWQQFSTPLDLAAVALILAAPMPSDIVLEPSAGNGLLVAQLPTVTALQLNEIEPARRARLQAVFPEAPISAHDGATIGSAMAASTRPTLIIMKRREISAHVPRVSSTDTSRSNAEWRLPIRLAVRAPARPARAIGLLT